jgi:hypothetical protein
MAPAGANGFAGTGASQVADRDRDVSFRAGLLLLLLGMAPYGPALAYSGVADVTLSWGVGGTAVSWVSGTSVVNTLAVVANSSHYSEATGSNSTRYFNSDFAAASDYTPGTTSDDCLTLLPGYNSIELRKYGCRQLSSSNLPVFHPSPTTDAGPAAAAVGTLYFTDTTLTGTLTVVATTDEPTGGNESSIGDGASGFNLRALDNATYGPVWYGINSGATLTVDLTGEFTATSWEITGGTVRLSDPGFQCQQGGIGGAAPDYVLCQISAVPGGLSSDGSHLSFGMDSDGGLPGVAMTPVQISDTDGTSIVGSLSGVLASLTVGAGGVVSTTFGEYRSGSGTNAGGCDGQIRWDGTRITCGTLSAGALTITGTATPVDTEPDAFSFSSVANVPVSTLVTSNTVTITGIEAPARVTVAGGAYSIGCTGTFTTAAGNIPDGGTVCVRHTSAATPGTDTVTTLDVGGIVATYTSTTVPVDTTPDAFVLVDQVDVAVSTEIVSAPVTITGINSPAPVSVSGGEYSVGCNGLYATLPGSVSPGQSVCVRHLSAPDPLTATNTTLTVGGVSDTFTSTTVSAPPDTTPDPFTFVDQANVPLNTVVTSAPVVITGLTAAAPISVVNGTYAIGCATYTASPGFINNGASVCIQHGSALVNSAPVTTTLTIGGVAGTFTSTTVGIVPPDTTPDAFAFADQPDVAVSSVITSAPVVVSGIDAPATVTVTGGTYTVSAGCAGAYTSAAGTVSNGESICVRHTSSATNGATVNTTLTVGGVSDTFSSTTVAAVPPDTTPDAFGFVDRTGVGLSTVITSAPVVIGGIDAPAPVSVTGGEYSVGCSASYTAAAGTVSNGQSICVRHTSSAANSATVNTTLTVGGVSDTFTSTTEAASSGGGGGGGGGGAVDLFLLGLLGTLPFWRRGEDRHRPGR